MIRYDTDRRAEVFEVWEVDPATLEDSTKVADAVGGSVSFGAFTDTKMDASIDFEGASAPSAPMLRIWYGFADADGERGWFPLATGYAAVGDLTIEGGGVRGSVALESPLRLLANDGAGYPYTVAAGARPVELAAGICRARGLHVIADDSAAVLSADHVFDAADSWLTVVNWLTSAAGFAAAWPDERGFVHLSRYVEPSDRATVAAFANDARSIVEPGIVRSTEGGAAVVRLSYADETCSVAATAAAGGQSALTESVRETVDEVAGDTPEAKAAELARLAGRRAIAAAGRRESLRFRAAWCGLRANDCISFDYAADSAGARIEGWRGAVASLSTSLEPGAPTDIEARRLVPPGTIGEPEGVVVWQATT